MTGCRPLTKNEVALTLRSFTGRYELRNRAMFVIGITTGFRISELLSLTIGDVWRHGKIISKILVKRQRMKGQNRGRSAVLTAFASKHLREWLGEISLSDRLEPDMPLFISRLGARRPISRIQAYRILRDAYEYCELDLNTPGTHTMRKTYAQRMYTALDKNIFTLQHALGHASPASTVAYLSFDETEIDQAAQVAWTE